MSTSSSSSSQLSNIVDHKTQSEDSKQSNQAQTHQGYQAFAPIPTKLPPPPIRRPFARTHQGSSTEQPQKTDISFVSPPGISTLDNIEQFSVLVDLNPTSNNNQNPDLLNALPSMSFNFDFNSMEPVEWDQFLVDTDLGEINTQAPVDATSPFTPSSAGSTPKSTESEQSAALDPEPNFDLDFGFDMPGITHNPEDIFGYESLQPPAFTAPDNRGMTDPTMTSTFGLSFADFGVHTDLGADAAAQLGLTNLLGSLEGVGEAAPVADHVNQSLTDAYAVLDKLLLPTPSPVAVQPAQLVLSPFAPAMKRKASEVSDDGGPAAKRRGRPPGSSKTKPTPLPLAKRPYRRQSKSTVADISPVPSIETLAADGDESDAESDAPVKLTASGKPSTARPKSVVPEKFLKDGSAQTLLGMNIAEIQSFPTFEELLKKVHASLYEGAREFGERIADNRDRAKDAAKKSRDERRAKIERAEVLEKKVEQLEAQVSVMTCVLLSLVEQGVLRKDQIAPFI